MENEYFGDPIKKYLLDEISQWIYVTDNQLGGSKALRVMNKCMLRGHRELAIRIERKYGRYFPKSDIVMAMGYALMAKNKEDENNRRS